MMNTKPILLLLLALPILSCERIGKPETQPEEGAPVYLSMGTKSLPEGEHTYRVTMVLPDGTLKGVGTYCSYLYKKTDGSDAFGNWLSPCLVNNNGDALKTDGSIASSLEEADKDAKYGLRFPFSGNTSVVISAVSPAVALKENSYYEWNAAKKLYLSETKEAYYDPWFDGQYIFDFSELKMIDRRATLSVHIECKEQPVADIQSVSLKYVNTARWYLPSGFSRAASTYTTDTVTWFDCGGEASNIIHLERENGDSWDSPAEGQYILPLDYSLDENAGMRPQVIVGLGTNTSKPRQVILSFSQKLEPMTHYTLDLFVSKSMLSFVLKATDWYDGGTIPTEDETWATIATGIAEEWDQGGTITADDWNTSF